MITVLKYEKRKMIRDIFILRCERERFIWFFFIVSYTELNIEAAAAVVTVVVVVSW